jgi:hypothetical protein
MGGYADDLYNIFYRIPTGSSAIVLPSELALTVIG